MQRGEGSLAELTPAFFVICALLAIAGGQKMLAPQSTVESLALIRIAAPSFAVRALGATEVALGVVAAVWPTMVTGALVAVLYAGFCAFVLLLLVRNPGQAVDCGCFGGAEHAVERLHLALNGLACAVAAAGAAIGVHGIGWVLG